MITLPGLLFKISDAKISKAKVVNKESYFLAKMYNIWPHMWLCFHRAEVGPPALACVLADVPTLGLLLSALVIIFSVVLSN